MICKDLDFIYVSIISPEIPLSLVLGRAMDNCIHNHLID